MLRRARSRSPRRKPPTPVRRTDSGNPASYAEPSNRSWADRMLSEMVDYNTSIYFLDEKDREGTNRVDQLVEILEEIHKLLTDLCTSSVSNEARK